MLVRARTRSHVLPLLAGVVAAAALPEVASAAEKVKVQILVIRATTANSKISPELKSLAGKLKKDFKYTGYKLEKRAGGSIDLKKSKKFALIGPYSAVVKPSAKGSKITFSFELWQESGKKNTKKFSTTLKLPAGKSQLLARWSLGKGDVMILAVSVK